MGASTRVDTRVSTSSTATSASLSDAPPARSLSPPCALVEAAVERAALNNHFVIGHHDMAALTTDRGLTDAVDLLPELVAATQKYARPPTSQFYVGAAALGASGSVYLGVNVEFQGMPLNASIHAEQFAVVTALRAGETALTAIATTEAPCGHCRQFMNELRGASAMRVIIPDKRTTAAGGTGGCIECTLAELLPHSFGPLDLTHDASLPLMLEPRTNAVTLAAGAEEDLAGGRCAYPLRVKGAGGRGKSEGNVNEEEPSTKAKAAGLSVMRLGEMLNAALTEANLAYAPYSSSPAGLALTTSSARVFSGRSVESAAYNPTMSPLHAALVGTVRDVPSPLSSLSYQRLMLSLEHTRPHKRLRHRHPCLDESNEPVAVFVTPLDCLEEGARHSMSSSERNANEHGTLRLGGRGGVGRRVGWRERMDGHHGRRARGDARRSGSVRGDSCAHPWSHRPQSGAARGARRGDARGVVAIYIAKDGISLFHVSRV